MLLFCPTVGEKIHKESAHVSHMKEEDKTNNEELVWLCYKRKKKKEELVWLLLTTYHVFPEAISTVNIYTRVLKIG